MMKFYKCTLLLPCLLAAISSTQARWLYSQSDYTSNTDEQRVMEMGELADEVERAQLATCTKMESLGQSIVTKMERLNCPHVQQGEPQRGRMNALTQQQVQEKYKCLSNEVRIGFEKTKYSVSRAAINSDPMAIHVPVTVMVLAGSFDRPKDSRITATLTLDEDGKNIPVADLEFSADIQRQTVNVRLPNQNNYEWTVSLFADFRELKNDVILHPRVATIKYYWDEAADNQYTTVLDQQSPPEDPPFLPYTGELHYLPVPTDPPLAPKDPPPVPIDPPQLVDQCDNNDTLQELESKLNNSDETLQRLESKLDFVRDIMHSCCCKEDTEVHDLPCCCVGTKKEPAHSCSTIASVCADCAVSGYYYIWTTTGGREKVYCDMNIDEECGGEKGWLRLAKVDMTNVCHDCPGELVEIKDGGKRLCTRPDRTADHGCSHARYNVSNILYSKVCGRVKGYQREAPDAFKHYWEMNRTNGTILEIDNDSESYVDGVSITTTSKKHIWTFAAAQDEIHNTSDNETLRLKHRERQCSCSISKSPTDKPDPAEFGDLLPPFVDEDHYFCDSGTRDKAMKKNYFDDPLWDGKGCGSNSSCCTFNNPPYFYRALDPTTRN